MKTKSIPVAAVLLLLLSILNGCNPSHPTPSISNKIKSYTIFTTSPGFPDFADTILYQYDNRGRVTDVKSTTDATFHITCRYNADSVYLTGYNNSTSTAWGTCNSQGFLTEIHDSPGNDDTTLCTYANGFLQSEKFIYNRGGYASFFFYEWTDSCMTAFRLDSINSPALIRYTYTNILENREIFFDLQHSDHSYYFVMTGLTGRPSKYLIQTANFLARGSSGHVSYSYTFDQYHRVTSVVQNAAIDTGTAIITSKFTYY